MSGRARRRRRRLIAAARLSRELEQRDLSRALDGFAQVAAILGVVAVLTRRPPGTVPVRPLSAKPPAPPPSATGSYAEIVEDEPDTPP